ncbi:DUF3307 domain-containing protein [Natronospora cellulosivora (SeqCode)]
MEEKLILALLVLAHFLADFVFQSDEVASKKKEKLRYLIKHIFGVFITYFVFIFIFFSIRLFIIITIITITHFIIDLYKIFLEKEGVSEIHAFFLDQFLHITVILFIYPFLIYSSVHGMIQEIFSVFIYYYPILDNVNIYSTYGIIIIVTAYIFVWKPGSHIVEKTLKNYKISKPESSREILINNQKETANPGELIGKLERVLLLSFIISNNFLAISIIFTAKSVARFSNFKDKDFANYYIIGTLISLLIAMGVGFLVDLLI